MKMIQLLTEHDDDDTSHLEEWQFDPDEEVLVSLSLYTS